VKLQFVPKWPTRSPTGSNQQNFNDGYLLSALHLWGIPCKERNGDDSGLHAFGHWTVFRWLVNRGRERLSITRSAKHITTLVVHGVADAASRLQLVITLLWYTVLRRCWCWSSQHRASVVLITLIIVLSLEPAISALCRRIYRAGQRDNQKLDHLSACDVIDADNKWERAIVVTDFPAKIVLCDGNFLSLLPFYYPSCCRHHNNCNN